ncbi:MAG: PilZ domain-containing protein [Acidobacteriota bacterium]
MSENHHLRSPRLRALQRPETPRPAGGQTRPQHSGGPAGLFEEAANTVTDPFPRERRRASRRPLRLGVEVYGYDGELSLIHAYGMTDNVSSQGLHAFIDASLPVGARAVVAVRSRHPALQPRILHGKVVRCRNNVDGFGIAIQFDLAIKRWNAGDRKVLRSA